MGVRIEAGPERDQLLVKRVTERVAVVLIAKEFGITRQAVHLNMKRLGLDTRVLRGEIVAELVERQASDEEIAAALGIDIKSAYYFARRHGLPRAERTTPLVSLYERCMSGDPDWLDIEERPRSERVQLVLEELRGELLTRPDREPVLHAITLWEQQESNGPRAQEIVQRARPRDGAARMRAA